MLTWNKLTLLVEKITKQYNYDLHRIIIQFILNHEFAVFQAPMSVEVCLRKLTSVRPAEKPHWRSIKFIGTKSSIWGLFWLWGLSQKSPCSYQKLSLVLPWTFHLGLFLSLSFFQTHRGQCLGSWFYLAAPLEKEMSTHSGSLAWWFPWTEERGGVTKSRTRLSHQHFHLHLCPKSSSLL